MARYFATLGMPDYNTAIYHPDPKFRGGWRVTISRLAITLLGLVLLPIAAVFAAQSEPLSAERPQPARLDLHDGDRVVLLGSTLVERDQSHGYTETALTERFADRNITFRNLGWSGDTVWSDARGQFDPPAAGFGRLKEHVLSLKPTVLILGYGTNESFAGEAGLPHFLDGLAKLLDALAETKVRVVLLSPMRMEKLPPPLPDPTRQNKNLKLYAEAIRKFAVDHHHTYVDLIDTLVPDAAAEAGAKKLEQLTDDGMHLTRRGYFRLAEQIEFDLLGLRPRWTLTINAAEGKADGAGCKLSDVAVKADRARLSVTDELLPLPLPPSETKIGYRYGTNPVVMASGLPAGRYELRVDGKPTLAATAEELAHGVPLLSDPSLEQAEELRQTINHKNELYFNRWRPQNVTYLFLFRKNEQGQNAAEIPKFDPLVAEDEQQIAKLRVPRPHVFELAPK